jgi:hypothetical protein
MNLLSAGPDCLDLGLQGFDLRAHGRNISFLAFDGLLLFFALCLLFFYLALLFLDLPLLFLHGLDHGGDEVGVAQRQGAIRVAVDAEDVVVLAEQGLDILGNKAEMTTGKEFERFKMALDMV